MTFKKKWFSSKVESTEGFFVQPISRAQILYGDSEALVYVSAEWLSPADGRMTWALYPNDMRIGSQDGPQLRDEPRRKLIVERIQAVFDFRGWRLDLD